MGSSQSLTVSNTLVSNMTMNSVMRQQTSCFSSLETIQEITVQNIGNAPDLTYDSDPTYVTQPDSCRSSSNPAYNPRGGVCGCPETKSSCTMCECILNQILAARYDLEAKAQFQNSKYVPQKATTDLETAMIASGCSLVCNDVVVEKVLQDSNLSASQTCNVQSTNQTDFNASFQAELSQSLTNQQDIFGQVAGLFSNSNRSVSSYIESNISQNITKEFVQNLHQSIFNIQSLKVQGHSIYVNQVQQQFKASQVGTLNIVIQTMDQLKQSAQFAITQTLVNTNDTIGSLTKNALGIIQNVADLIQTIAFQIIVIITAVIVTLAIILLIRQFTPQSSISPLLTYVQHVMATKHSSTSPHQT